MKNYGKTVKKNYLFKMAKFLLTFFIDIITPVISSAQVTCDAMCTTCNSLIFPQSTEFLLFSVNHLNCTI